MTEELLTRIADALDRLAPPPLVEADPAQGMHFRWDQRRILPVRASTPLPLERFVGVDHQIAALCQNLSSLAAGAPAHDILLWGARGTGKSALVRSVAWHHANVPLIETSGDALLSLPALFDRLADVPRPFLVYVDDLAFTGADPGVRMLRSLLDGGVAERPANVRLAVTSNHRHLVMRDPDVTEASGARHTRDAADDQLALADRFGMILGFHVPSQDEYLEMVRRHLDGAPFDPQDALAFALARGGRSGRTAWHYRTEFLSRASVPG
ncbi:MAG: DUF815 domain-containing protein [Sphingomonadaceae bacterium]